MTMAEPTVQQQAPEVETGKKNIELEAFVNLTEDGALKKRIIKEGTGEYVPNGANVEVHYVGTLYSSGEKFDASRDRGTPFTFRIGQGQVIKGWDVGVKSMRVGELADLLCEPDYGYGARGSPPTIPPNSTLKFEVEVLGYEEVAETPQQHFAAAQKKREEGNALFRGQSIRAAKSAYSKALEHIDSSEGAGDGEEIRKMKIAVLGNLSMCGLKLGETNAAVGWCQQVLALEPSNTKASYRLGQAYQALSEFDSAIEALNQGIKADEAGSGDLKTLMAHVRKAKMEAGKKEKAMYKNMFGGR